jgi:hypothetical protein
MFVELDATRDALDAREQTIRADERERCARIVEMCGLQENHIVIATRKEIAAAIRRCDKLASSKDPGSDTGAAQGGREQ